MSSVESELELVNLTFKDLSPLAMLSDFTPSPTLPGSSL